jgi:hypothetical protein
MKKRVLERVAGFVEECCLVARNARAALSALYLAYGRWCRENGLPDDGEVAFVGVLETCGLVARGPWVEGLALRPRERPRAADVEVAARNLRFPS